jgi:hypothetical protein
VDLSTFIVAVFCLVDDRLRGLRLRTRGSTPKLSDAEVLTLEIVGEFLGIDTDKGIRLFFKRHYAEWFPALGEVHRTTFARQAANLWKVKERLWQELLAFAPHDPDFALVDSMPLPACLFARATGASASAARRPSARTRCSSRPSTASGCTRGSRGPVSSPASRWPRPTPTSFPSWRRSPRGPRACSSGRNYHSPKTKEELAATGVELLAPYSSRKKDPAPKRSALLSRLRYRIDTVFGHLAGRYSVKRVWARDLWHLTSRLLRKVLSHTLAFLLNHRAGNRPLQLAKLLVLQRHFCCGPRSVLEP